MSPPPPDLSTILPRVLIVSRRCVRKNKFVDFVGEYHLDLIVSYGAVPVIVPRVTGVHMLLDSFEPIHGVLLCEGEDIDPSLYDSDELSGGLTTEELEEIRSLHISDTAIDHEKDSIELRLARLCRDRGVPYLGICRGSQVLNVASGGTLYQDIEKEMSRNGRNPVVAHIDYENYDGHRHKIRVVEGTPLSEWFRETLSEEMEMEVNSYHHQGVKRLGEGFVPMAFSDDGLIEGFYDPKSYDPEHGKFLMGLQFHPERMRRPESAEFDYPGCPRAYQEFVMAVIAYQKKVSSSAHLKTSLKLNQEMEQRRKMLVRSFSLAKNLYSFNKQHEPEPEEPMLEVGAEFLESNAALSLQQEKRLKQMGATVRNASLYLEKLKMSQGREKMVRGVMENMSPENLSELLSFYHMMERICSEVLERKLGSLNSVDEDDDLQMIYPQ